MNKSLIYFTISLLLLHYSVVCKGQAAFGYYQDALRYSQSNTSYGATARMRAVGGAQTSLGGDISAAAANPAGLGFFNRSVVTLTPVVDFISADSDYFGFSQEASKSNFHLGNVGAAIHFGKGRFSDDSFKGGTLAITLNRSNSFHLDRSIEAPNDFNSVIDSFIEAAGTTPPNQLSGYENGAYEQYLINPVFSGNGETLGYDSFVLGFPIQSENIKESGSHNQLNIAWGGNHADWFYFGAGLGVQLLDYKQTRDYRERDFVVFDDQGNSTPDEFLNTITIYDELNVRGNGVNFNVGTIIRPISILTLGISYTSPTYLSFDEESFFDLSADWLPGTTITETDEDGNETVIDISDLEPYQGPLVVSEYSMQTPSRVAVGATIFLGKAGFLTADVERVDYSNATVRSGDFETAADNEVIESLYTDVLNMRFGAELRFNHIRIRGGYAIFPSPYESADILEQKNYSAGLGYRNPSFFVDLALIRSERSSLYVPYQVSFDQPVASSFITTTSVALSVGLTF